MPSVTRHDEETMRNVECWEKKPTLRRIYKAFYEVIADQLGRHSHGLIVELGSGMGNIKEVIPACIRTDIFPNQANDQVENAYSLSFPNSSVSALILFDVFHHLRFPGTALREFNRVLVPGGRVILFEPCLSVLGLLVYGVFHPEPLGMTDPIQWDAPFHQWSTDADYYAAQSNASRVFIGKEFYSHLSGWDIVKAQRFSAISYVASGGYSQHQFYPDSAYAVMRMVDHFCDFMPSLFATRLLVVLDKVENHELPPHLGSTSSA